MGSGQKADNSEIQSYYTEKGDDINGRDDRRAVSYFGGGVKPGNCYPEKEAQGSCGDTAGYEIEGIPIKGY